MFNLFRVLSLSLRLSLCSRQRMPKMGTLICLVLIKKRAFWTSCVLWLVFLNASSHLCFQFFFLHHYLGYVWSLVTKLSIPFHTQTVCLLMRLPSFKSFFFNDKLIVSHRRQTNSGEMHGRKNGKCRPLQTAWSWICLDVSSTDLLTWCWRNKDVGYVTIVSAKFGLSWRNYQFSL